MTPPSDHRPALSVHVTARGDQHDAGLAEKSWFCDDTDITRPRFTRWSKCERLAVGRRPRRRRADFGGAWRRHRRLRRAVRPARRVGTPTGAPAGRPG